MALPVKTLSRLLATAADTNAGIVTYAPNAGITAPIRITYRSLYEDASEKARLIFQIYGSVCSSIFLLHFDNHIDNIVWFWAVILAGYLPAISTPLAYDHVQRTKHVSHLYKLLKDPIVLTRSRLLPEFPDSSELSLQPVETISLCSVPKNVNCFDRQRGDDLAVLMLTSGSTGNAKAVGLGHAQILLSIAAKSEHHCMKKKDTFLNWIGMDHVANLTEIHLQAMALGAEQIHVQAADVLADPMLFLQLLSKHKVAYTFSPNFFMGRLRDTIAESDHTPSLDLSHLRAFISGGESNIVETCATLTQQFRTYGIKADVIRPGFGMTETCAGSIYSRCCPSYDLERHLELACLGTCIPGIKIRLVNGSNTQTTAGEVGDLHVKGPIVFKAYFNDSHATKASFSDDGWFITGDRGYLDPDSSLNLVGRSKDVIITNGVNFSCHEIETAIDEERIIGVVPSSAVVFPCRPPNSDTERIVIIYVSEYGLGEEVICIEATNAIAKVTALMTGTKPFEVLPLPGSSLEKSSLGKVSRTKLKSAYESGEFCAFQAENTKALDDHRASSWRVPATTTEKKLVDIISHILVIPAPDLNANANIFDLGITSFNLITMKSQIQEAVTLDQRMSYTILLEDPTISGISATIDATLCKKPAYNPVVRLQVRGHKIPLWCVHPGSGDILVFIALSQQFTDRAVYALRARGLNPGETSFSSTAEAVTTYVQHIKRTQPSGPYAIVGYSLGSTFAFEAAKRLGEQGEEVRFLGSLDFPPFISEYVGNLQWADVLLHTVYFLELIDEPTMVRIAPAVLAKTRDEALDFVLDIADRSIIQALDYDKAKLARVTDIADAFRKGVVDYKPTKGVKHIDVFVADPPFYAAKDRNDWRVNHLGRWRELSEENPIFHECEGVHAKLLNREYVGGFAKKLKAALKRRGV